MLTQYKNIDKIRSAKQSISATRLTDLQLQKLSTDAVDIVSFNTYASKYNTELHVYSEDIWISGIHDLTRKNLKVPTYTDPETNREIQLNSAIAINLYDELENIKLTSGVFSVVVNFFRNLIGNYKQQLIYIDDISPDRTELRLKAIDATNSIWLEQITDYIASVDQTTASSTNKFYKTYLLNFSRNKTVHFINSVVIGDQLFVKLLDPLPNEFKIGFKCWVVEELKQPYIDKINILPAFIEKRYRQLGNPNWNANATYNASTETGFRSWNDLLSSNIQTSQQVIDTYFSSSIYGMQLNIDYSDFNNFIFYSSATERLENFKYKLELLEYYTQQSSSISTISGSVAIDNAIEYSTKKQKLISGFDAFEQYLYFQSSSKITTHDIPQLSYNVEHITGSYITPVPKTNSTKPYVLVSTTSSQFTNWYDGLAESASLYDSLNLNSLTRAIPEYIRYDNSNSQLDTFVNMLGHHYDLIYTYINHMTRINKREENPKLGMPNELLYQVAKQFGWNLIDGNQYQNLWKYVYGTDSNGVPLTGSNSINGESMPGRDMTYSVWRRIVNNLPLLLKSKGTKRSIRALLSCYGVPQSFITISEYGGPRLERAPIYEKLNFDYALDLINNNAGDVIVNYSQSIDSVELRFRTDSVITNPMLPNTMNLYTIGSNTVTLDYTSGTLGTIQINGTSSANIEMFDGGWLNTVLRTSGNKLEIVAKRSKYGKIVAAVSASATASFAYSGSLTLGGATGGSRLQGQLQELRLWTGSLSDEAFNNHVKAPGAYNGTSDAIEELIFRLPLTNKTDHSVTNTLTGIQPVASTISASFSNWTNNTPYDSIEETYYYDGISLGAGTYDDNKIRIEDNNLTGYLAVNKRAEQSQFDDAPLDSNRIGVYFSPQTFINEDIIAQFGFISLDDYIGDPGETEKHEYPRLIQKSHDYWKKYINKNDFNAYIKIFSLFDLSFFKQLEQLLPARANKLTGVLIQPNLLERSKDTLLPDLSKLDLTYESVISDTFVNPYGSYILYTGSLHTNIDILESIYTYYDSEISSQDIISIQGYDDDQWSSIIAPYSQSKYDSVKYSYSYLLWAGTEYVTGSTPYWLREASLPVIIDSVTSDLKVESYIYQPNISSSYGVSVYGSASYGLVGAAPVAIYAKIQDYLPIGLENARYNGSKMTSPDFNIRSIDTIDGGPVVEWNSANKNQLIYQSNGSQGSFRIT